MKSMKIMGSLILFLLVAVFSASGETVLLYSMSPEGTEDAAYSIFYMEDGIMDVFFQAGHIIFNGTYQSEEAELPADVPFEDRPSFRMAKAGGASLVLEICLHFSGREDEILPESVDYLFVDVLHEKNIAEGSVSIAEAGDPEELEDFELVRMMGRKVGLSALRGM